jgi:hypothetical protein
MGYETAAVNNESMKARATMLTAKGMIGISVQIYLIMSNGRSVSLLEVSECERFSNSSSVGSSWERRHYGVP